MKTIVLKLGGEIVHSPELDVVARDLRTLVEGWHRVAIVHGGGPQATALQKRLGLETMSLWDPPAELPADTRRWAEEYAMRQVQAIREKIFPLHGL